MGRKCRMAVLWLPIGPRTKQTCSFPTVWVPLGRPGLLVSSLTWAEIKYTIDPIRTRKCCFEGKLCFAANRVCVTGLVQASSGLGFGLSFSLSFSLSSSSYRFGPGLLGPSKQGSIPEGG